MKPLSEFFKSSSAYWGERGNWLVAYTTTRDADCLGRSNWRCFLKLLGAEGNEGKKGSQSISENLAIEEASHWACGWVQYLIINPEANELVQRAETALESLDGYPVLNEEDFSNEETVAANLVWRDCYRPKERIEYVRKHRREFEFHGFSDMLACLRGNYFAGYASELLN